MGAIFLVALAQACGSRGLDGGGTPLSESDGGSTSRDGASGFFVDVLPTTGVNKADLLFMIDNSISMVDKQAVLAEAVPALMKRLVSPRCVGVDDGKPNSDETPDDPAAPCPSSFVREFTPPNDVHVGVITSSIGSHGSSLCAGDDSNPLTQQQNDHGWLIGKRSRFSVPDGGADTASQGFLDWNPGATQATSLTAFETTFQAMIADTGEHGCGYEAQLESIYRFLIDPHPYYTITTSDCPGSTLPCAVPHGLDSDLLAQRAAFLRPDSAVAIVMLTDENDCSIQESGQFYYAARQEIVLPHGSSACDKNPNDPCCYSCEGSAPPGCKSDPICSGTAAQTDPTLDPPNLRCFHQKQRFGLDFLYPTARYVNALTQPQICTSRADLAPVADHCADLDGDGMPDIFDNPLFISSQNSVARDPSLIFLAGALGVPWQDVRTDVTSDGTPYDPDELHFATAAQLSGNGAWKVILGDDTPDGGGPPVLAEDNLMVESVEPRDGNDGEDPPQALAPPDSPPAANPVNGHERNNPDGQDLQYACIFQLPKPRNCTVALQQNPPAGCDCPPGGKADQNPLCQSSDGTYSTTQRAAKAYPGLRELRVLKDFGANSVVASICPRNLTEKSKQDYGYGPVADALIDRFKDVFAPPCLTHELPVEKDRRTRKTHLACDVLEVSRDDGKPCSAAKGRSDPSDDVVNAALSRLKDTHACDQSDKPRCRTLKVCGIEEAGDTCHQNVPQTETGFCYIDPDNDPSDDPTLVATCPQHDPRRLRFVDPLGRTPAADATVVLVCR